MKISKEIQRDLNKPKRVITVNDYRLPVSNGNVPKEVKTILDNACFAPIGNMLSHSLDLLGSEGLPLFPGYAVLTGLVQNGLIRAGVEMRSNELTKKWGEFAFAGDIVDDDIEQEQNQQELNALSKLAEKLHLQEKLNSVASLCGYYGGCLMYLDTGADMQELVNPLVISPATFTELKGLKIIEPFNVSPGLYNSVNPLASDYYKPSVWYVQGIPVHESRLIVFKENELPSMLKPAYNFFGLSLAQKVLDAVSHFTQNRECASRLLNKYSTIIFKTDMQNVLAGDFDDILRARVQYFVQNRDNDGVATIDKETEEMENLTNSLSGVVDIVRQSMEYVAAMFNEPVVKMWGLSPAGFNTGESDMKNHYDNIEGLQVVLFGEAMQRLIKIMCFQLGIQKPVVFNWAPLDETDTEKIINENKIKAETYNLLMEQNIIRPEEARENLINDLDSGFNNLVPYTEPEPLTPEELAEIPAVLPEV